MRIDFGNRVKEMRLAQGISLRKFALMIGINKSYLVDIEHGRKSPTLSTIEKIARGLNVSFTELFANLGPTDLPE